MKGRNILCVSQASTAICMSHMADHIHPSSPPPSSSSSSLPSSSSSAAATHYGGRSIDRHNPIIRDSRRPTLHAPCSSSPRAAVNPTPYHQLIQKKPSSTKKKKSSSADVQNRRKSTSSVPVISSASIFTSKLLAKQPDRTVTVNKKKEEEDTAKFAELITPPGSSRYLLSETDYIDGLSDLPDPIVELQQVLPAVQEQKKLAVVVHQDDINNNKQSSALPPKSSSSSRFKSDQVVVLRVSLHCKGCEGKVRKHISRMEGVTSFNIDFKAKKVTVVGDVTPLSVLASVSKVKTAQLWTSTAPLDAVANNR